MTAPLSVSPQNLVECDWCHERHPRDEMSFDDKMLLCDDCWDRWFDENSFDCCCCGEQKYDSQQADAFVMAEDQDEMKAGVYAILSYPFYLQPTIGCGSIMEWCVRRIADLPAKLYMDTYECGFICKRCAKPWARKIAAERKKGVRFA